MNTLSSLISRIANDGSSLFNTTLARENWVTKYQYGNETPIETEIRKAKGFAAVEDESVRDYWTEQFLQTLVKFEKTDENKLIPVGLKFTPGGRISANIGTAYKGATLLNCFINYGVQNARIQYSSAIPGTDQTIEVDMLTQDTPDSLANIMLTLLEQAETLKSEGGWGINFDFIRPRASLIKGVGIDHPGVVRFMEIFDKVSDVIVSGNNDGYKDTVKNLLEKNGEITDFPQKKMSRKGAMMAALTCLSGDTKINTMEGNIPIRDLVGKSPYVYSSDESGKVCISKASAVFSQGVKKVIRVHFDNGDFIDCTPDHRFMTSKGDWVEAKDLSFTTSLRALNKRLLGKYIELGFAGTRSHEPEHLASFKYKYGRYPTTSGLLFDQRVSTNTIAHHVDFTTTNNLPENIIEMTLTEHVKVHEEHSGHFQKARVKTASERKGKTWVECYGHEKAKDWKKKFSDSMKGKTAWNKGLTGDKYKEYYKDGYFNQFTENANHKVLKIEDLGHEIEVFDMSIPVYHNFVAEGVVVHNCSHPDCEEFIRAKQTPGKLTKFNLSILVDDEFMEAVKKDGLYNQHFNGKVYKTIRAKELYDLIMSSTYNRAEPGVLYKDNAHKNNPIAYMGECTASNPCFPASEKLYTQYGYFTFGELYASGEELYVQQDGRVTSVDEDTFIVDPNNTRFGTVPSSKVNLTQKNADILKITFEDGLTLRLTPNHRLFTETSAICAKDIVAGDYLLSIGKNGYGMDKGTKKVVSVVPDGKEDVYCVTENLHRTIIVNDIVAARCGEIFGNPHTSTVCCLGSLNLTMYVNEDRSFDWETYKKDITVGVRMLDNVNDISLAPLDQYKWAAKNIRQFGMGVNGLGSALYMLGIAYNSAEGIDFTEQVNKVKEETTWQTSALLAQEKGVFPAYNKALFENTNWFTNFTQISEETKDLIRAHGVRNAKTTANPPLGNCVKYNTIIDTNKGLVQIKAIFDNLCIDTDEKRKWHVCQNDWRVKTLTGEYKPVTGFFVNDVSPTVVLKLEDTLFEATPHHRLLVKTEETKGVWKCLSDLTKDDLIVCAAPVFDERNTKLHNTIHRNTTTGTVTLPFGCTTQKIIHIGSGKAMTFDLEVAYNHNYVTSKHIINHNSSIICNMVSNGIEPVFCPEYERTYITNEWPKGMTVDNVKVLLPQTKAGDATVWRGEYASKTYYYEPHNRGLCIIEPVRDYGYEWVLKHYPQDVESEASYLVTAQSLTVKEHVDVQAVVQKHINQSVSKTANLPADYTLENMQDLYIEAWEKGLTGFTTYRAGSMEAVIATKSVEKTEVVEGAKKEVSPIIVEGVKLPDLLINGNTTTIRRENSKFYLHFSYLPEDVEKECPLALWVISNYTNSLRAANPAVKALKELCFNKGIKPELINSVFHKTENDTANNRIGRAVSFCLRHRVPMVDIIDTLTSLPENDVSTLVSAVRNYLAQTVPKGTKAQGVCSACDSTEIVYDGGCVRCLTCGESGCS